MPRSILRPASLHNGALFAAATARQLRRAQLWHEARLACPTYEFFRASIGAIERAIASRLETEFGC